MAIDPSQIPPKPDRRGAIDAHIAFLRLQARYDQVFEETELLQAERDRAVAKESKLRREVECACHLRPPLSHSSLNSSSSSLARGLQARVGSVVG